MTENIILAVVLLAILGGAITYIIKAKKRGQKCIGCPYSNSCGKNASCSCGEGK